MRYCFWYCLTVLTEKLKIGNSNASSILNVNDFHKSQSDLHTYPACDWIHKLNCTSKYFWPNQPKCFLASIFMHYSIRYSIHKKQILGRCKLVVTIVATSYDYWIFWRPYTVGKVKYKVWNNFLMNYDNIGIAEDNCDIGLNCSSIIVQLFKK